ncbi:hypothetical protein VTJ83DRAFT_4807 [Remersonia thermophila]|uniref:Restriction endonuclease type IV Mrr domain-containing protein n=1 Tax=Remersonia thermophila TaxID=72144 RepID=A0ABR4DB08_9PEZI
MRSIFIHRSISFRLPLPVLPPRRTFTSASSEVTPESTPNSNDSPQPSSPSQQPPQTPQQQPPLIYPTPPSAPQHTDLPSFLAYAERTYLDPSSTFYVGTHFEYTVQRALSRFGLDLRRIGGASDCGIDLLGTWALPFPSSSSSSLLGAAALPSPLRVLAQCKAVRRPGPHFIRELEGAFSGAPAGWRAWTEGGRGGGVLGLLVAEKPATKGIREALARSRWPMGYVACSREGQVSQMLWNRRAEEEGLEGFGVALRYVDGDSRGAKEVVLTWKGERVPSVRGQEEAR